MVSKLYYKPPQKDEFSGSLLRDKKGISHIVWDLHLVSSPVFSDYWIQWEGAPSTLLVGQSALVMILLGIKIVPWKCRRGKGKDRHLHSVEGKLRVRSDTHTPFFCNSGLRAQFALAAAGPISVCCDLSVCEWIVSLQISGQLAPFCCSASVQGFPH